MNEDEEFEEKVYFDITLSRFTAYLILLGAWSYLLYCIAYEQDTFLRRFAGVAGLIANMYLMSGCGK
jgi:hypothetical protein